MLLLPAYIAAAAAATSTAVACVGGVSVSEWLVLVPTLGTSVSACAVAIINATRSKETLRQITPPSQPEGGRTLGAIMEGTHTAAEVAAVESMRTRRHLQGNPGDKP